MEPDYLNPTSDLPRALQRKISRGQPLSKADEALWLAADGSRQARSGAGYMLRRVVVPFLLKVCLPVLLVLLAFAAGRELGPAVSAAQGHGIRGYFVAESGCGSCGEWHGVFELADGKVIKTDADFAGRDPGMAVGSTVPALDTGAVHNVFPRHGANEWELVAGLLGGCIAALGGWAWAVLIRPRQVRARRARQLFGASPAGPAF
jgi:hypothetical protein